MRAGRFAAAAVYPQQRGSFFMTVREHKATMACAEVSVFLLLP